MSKIREGRESFYLERKGRKEKEGKERRGKGTRMEKGRGKKREGKGRKTFPLESRGATEGSGAFPLDRSAATKRKTTVPKRTTQAASLFLAGNYRLLLLHFNSRRRRPGY